MTIQTGETRSPGLPVWIEASVMALDYVIFGGGNRTSKPKVPPRIFEHLHNCEIIPGHAAPA
jgi:prolyl-tRNA editing enzyme YbaK/EbsC (Cys-tRNA(Pro) deacylase)